MKISAIPGMGVIFGLDPFAIHDFCPAVDLG